MYRLLMLSVFVLYTCRVHGAELVKDDYHRPLAADGLTIETQDSSAAQDGLSPLTSPPQTVSLTSSPYTGQSPLFPGVPSDDALNSLLSPHHQDSAQEQQLACERLRLSDLEPRVEQRRSCRRKHCYMLGGCVGALALGAIIFVIDRYTHIF